MTNGPGDEVEKGTVSEHEDCFGTFKKLVRNSECSKSDDFKKLSVLARMFWPEFSVSYKEYVYPRWSSSATFVSSQMILRVS